MLLWGNSPGTLIVVVDDTHIHLVANPTTQQASYYDDVPFSAVSFELPAVLRGVLPS